MAQATSIVLAVDKGSHDDCHARYTFENVIWNIPHSTTCVSEVIGEIAILPGKDVGSGIDWRYRPTTYVPAKSDTGHHSIGVCELIHR